MLEMVERGTRPVERIFVVRGRSAGLGRLLRAAREADVPVTHLTREALVRKVGAKAVHQGVAARVAARRYDDVERPVEARAACCSGRRGRSASRRPC